MVHCHSDPEGPSPPGEQEWRDTAIHSAEPGILWEGLGFRVLQCGLGFSLLGLACFSLWVGGTPRSV